MERLWALLGGSWALLGASWTLLEATWRRPNHHKNNMQKKSNFQTPKRRVILRYVGGFGRPKSTNIGSKTSQIFDRFFGRFWSLKGCLKGGFPGAKIDPNRSQRDSKLFKMIVKTEKVGLQEPLGAVLGRSWGILEAILGAQKALRYWKT